MSQLTPSPSTPAPAPLTETQFRQMGEQITEQYHKAEIAQLDIITLGAMLMQVEGFSGTCAIKPGPKGGRPGDTGLKGWLKTYAPKVEYTKARRYRDIAEAMRIELCLKSADQLVLVAGTSTGLDPKLAKKRAQLVDFVANKSVRGLQLELGLMDPVPARGGAHAGKDKAGADSTLRPPCPKLVNTQAMRDHYAALSDQQAIAFCATWHVELKLAHLVESQAPLALHDADRDRLRTLVQKLAAQVGIKIA